MIVLTSTILLPPARINWRDSTGRFSQSRLLIRAGVRVDERTVRHMPYVHRFILSTDKIMCISICSHSSCCLLLIAHNLNPTLVKHVHSFHSWFVRHVANQHQVLFSYCFLTVFLLFSYCFLAVFLLFSYCFLTVFLLFSYCFLTVFLLFSYLLGAPVGWTATLAAQRSCRQV